LITVGHPPYIKFFFGNDTQTNCMMKGIPEHHPDLLEELGEVVCKNAAKE
jgi:hypothetical protein